MITIFFQTMAQGPQEVKVAGGLSLGQEFTFHFQPQNQYIRVGYRLSRGYQWDDRVPNVSAKV
jgi:hypothetical protein